MLGAESPKALAQQAREIGRDLVKGSLVYLAHKTQQSFNPKSAHRLAVIAANEAELTTKLNSLADRVEQNPGNDVELPDGCRYSASAQDGKVAFLFPGQGSQYLNMGSDIACAWEHARQPWDEVADVALDAETSLHRVVFPIGTFSDEDLRDQEQTLKDTRWAQPAMGVTSLATSR